MHRFQVTLRQLLVGVSVAALGFALIETARQVQRAKSIRVAVEGVTFSPDGRFLIVGANYWMQGAECGQVERWNFKTRRRDWMHRRSGMRVAGLSLAPNGTEVAMASSDGMIDLLNVADGKVLRTVATDSYTQDVAFLPDGERLAVQHRDAVELFNVATGKQSALFPTSVWGRAAFAISADGHRLAVTRAGSVNVWDVAKGGLVHSFKPRKVGMDWALNPTSLTFSPDGVTLASGCDDGTIRLRENTPGRMKRVIRAHSVHVGPLAYSLGGAVLASGTLYRPFGLEGPQPGVGELKLWNVATGRLLHALNGHSHEITGLSFSRDSRTLASASRDGSVIVWDVASGAKLWALRPAAGSLIPPWVYPSVALAVLLLAWLGLKCIKRRSVEQQSSAETAALSACCSAGDLTISSSIEAP
jgi:WD40 repeat protein